MFFLFSIFSSKFEEENKTKYSIKHLEQLLK